MKTSHWPVDDAKTKFSSLLSVCSEHGPQTITRNGKPVAFLLSAADYHLMSRPLHKVNTRAKERRLKKLFPRALKGNPVLEDRR